MADDLTPEELAALGIVEEAPENLEALGIVEADAEGNALPQPEPALGERIEGAFADLATPEGLAHRASGVMGPAVQAVMSPAKIAGDVIREGAGAPIVKEAKKIGGALAGGAYGWADKLTDDLASGEGDRLSSALRDLGLKAFGGPLMPFAPIIRAKGGGEAATEAVNLGGGVVAAGKEMGAGLLETLIKGRVDEDRPIASSGDIAAMGGAAARFAPSSTAAPGSGYRSALGVSKPRPSAPTATPSQARALEAPRGTAKALRTKSKHMTRQGEYKDARAHLDELKAQKSHLDAQRLAAIERSPLNPKLEAARAAKKAARREFVDVDKLLQEARAAGVVPDELAAAAKQAKLDAGATKAAFKKAKLDRAATIPREYTRGAWDKSLEVKRAMDPVKQAQAGVRKLETQMPDSVASRAVNKAAQGMTNIPTAVKESPGILLGDPKITSAIARALMGGSRASTYLSQILGDVTIAGADDAAAAAAQIQHLAGTDPQARALLELALKE